MNLVNRIYNRTIRPYLPNTVGVLNGVATPFPKYLDRNVVHHDYEKALIDGIRKMATPGDKVAVIGGGRGVSAVVAAHHVGKDGQVSVFEAVPEQVDKIKTVAAMNKVEDRVQVHQGTVGGKAYNTIFDLDAGDTVRVDTIPRCDYLVMDCEGCEQFVLENLAEKPDKLLVETHGNFGFPTADTRELMLDMDYEITYEEAEFEDADIYLLGGEQ